jgi:CheY-like chemotaxis protein
MNSGKKAPAASKANLLEPETFPASKFDVIFARNVFIYFSENNVKKIALSLANKLENHGLLISGVSEPLRFDEWKLSVIAPSSYVFESAPAKAMTTDARPSPIPSVKPDQVAASAKYSVLCVDDSPTIQLLIKKIYSSDPNCELLEIANNGQEARVKLNQKKFDVITLDIHMPVMGGIEFLETQYKPNIDPPVIMVSSVNRTDIDLATKSLKLGAFDYVEKPAMNNLQKSIDEILTKTRMAIKSAKTVLVTTKNEEFEDSIGQKIVVPDASTCLRWISLGMASLSDIEPILNGADKELRSPPLVICLPDNRVAGFESLASSWTERPLSMLNEPKNFLKPNSVYFCSESQLPDLVKALKSRSVSLQVLGETQASLAAFKSFPSLQVLVHEPNAPAVSISVKQAGLGVSDITPCTSFVSLSLEYFANLRKAA